ncbi:uncharacterized protein MONBRDRAFT_33841 [Monosiga brevicollis MX1]|uniref:Cation-transporting P-type ATPase C-terminal domain-containing protein n=1 Tax=Monosiga brevicollis TaxID=81824 RepID=A9V7V4_MONBE|nr:uncharacterized protein MONBRDRAFT_33841 [Monosiga brevicollis MX1]EDQ86370.1 predicted protein [Monosiga brevicollis MX1]|eukprot:XP_001748760.1 hypothetical protein [Monosiga brevicollis MX1]
MLSISPAETVPRLLPACAVTHASRRTPRQACETAGFLYPQLAVAEVSLSKGDVFAAATEMQESPAVGHPFKRVPFRVLETPLGAQLREAKRLLDSRSNSWLQISRLTTSILLQRACICIFVVTLIASLLHVLLTPDDIGTWTEQFFVIPIMILLPLLPLSWPYIWIFSNHFVVARTLAMFLGGNVQETKDDDSSLDSWEEEDADTDSSDTVIFTPSSLVWSTLWRIMKGDYLQGLVRHTNLVFVLGTLSTLTFLDKEGVLADPAPQPDRVMFFDSNEDEDAPLAEATVATELKLTRPESTSFGSPVTFEDSDARTMHSDSLRPIGLNVLLNTHCMHSDHGADFMDHLAAIDVRERGAPSCDHLPSARCRSYTQRQVCMCPLAAAIGFTSEAVDRFRIYQRLVTVAPYHDMAIAQAAAAKERKASFVAPENGVPDFMASRVTQTYDETANARRHRLLLSLAALPHMIATVVEEDKGKTMQMLSSGTCEMVLDHCTGAWDGMNVVPLDEKLRSRILDFQAAHADGMSCYALAYRPMRKISTAPLKTTYAEIGADSAAAIPLAARLSEMAAAVPKAFRPTDAAPIHEHPRLAPHKENSRNRLLEKFTRMAKKHAANRPPSDSPRKRRPKRKHQHTASLEDLPRATSAAVDELSDVAGTHKSRSPRTRRFDSSATDDGDLRDGEDERDERRRDPADNRSNSHDQHAPHGQDDHTHASDHDSDRDSQHEESHDDFARQPRYHSASISRSIDDGLRSVKRARSHSHELYKPPSGEMRTFLRRSETDGDFTRPNSAEHTRRRSTSSLDYPHARRSLEHLGESAPHDFAPANVSDHDTQQASDDHEEDGVATAPISPVSDSPLHESKDMDDVDFSVHPSRLLADTNRVNDNQTTAANLGLPFRSTRAASTSSTPSNWQRSLENIQRDQILLGAIGVRHRASEDVTELIKDLNDAGIRFVYFSAENELQSKALAEDMGLETGWNCFISLSDDGQGGDAYVINHANLPRGIQAVRPHLSDVDNVPLLVPLFSEASPSATQEMIAIMQENDRVVFLMAIVLPCMAISMLFTRGERAIMKVHTSRAKDRITSVQYLLGAFGIRCLTTGFVCVITFALMLFELCAKRDGTCHSLLGDREFPRAHTWNGRATEELEELVFAQNTVAWLFTFYTCISSMSYLHRTRGVHRFNPLRNKIWVVLTALALALQTLYFFVALSVVRGRSGPSVYLSDVRLPLSSSWVAPFRLWPM